MLRNARGAPSCFTLSECNVSLTVVFSLSLTVTLAALRKMGITQSNSERHRETMRDCEMRLASMRQDSEMTLASMRQDSEWRLASMRKDSERMLASMQENSERRLASMRGGDKGEAGFPHPPW